MSAKIYPIPSYDGDAIDLVYLDPAQAEGHGLVHYAFAIAAAEENADTRRRAPWAQMQNFRDPSYQAKQSDIMERLSNSFRGYSPGELSLGAGVSAETEMNTTIRLGALELLGNISSGRLAATSKDPFPHQLALQQFMKTPTGGKRRRILIADEVGLGKTIEAGLIIRDLLLARGSLDDFSCLYLTSGGLVEDAAGKLREVLKGVIGDQRLVETVDSFRRYGHGGVRGVHVASTHAARGYVTEKKKGKLPKKVAPRVLIVDECHHAACGDDLSGRTNVLGSGATQTYKAIWQLISGDYWADSHPPELVVLMSATPFRSKNQFVNLLRLLAHRSQPIGEGEFNAFSGDVDVPTLLSTLGAHDSGVDVVWRRQDDKEVHSWSNRRLFPNLQIVRPHLPEGMDSDVTLRSPGPEFLDLLDRIRRMIRDVAKEHGATFGGFATAQLEKKLTSSSIAGATTLFSWAVRHSHWQTKSEFDSDRSRGTAELRTLLRSISKRLAKFDGGDTIHASVVFASEGFEFPAKNLSQAGQLPIIYDFAKKIRDSAEPAFVITSNQVLGLCSLANEILGIGVDAGAPPVEDAKLEWLQRMLARHPGEKFLVFTESLQTCEIICKALGASAARKLVGSMVDSERQRSVRDLRSNANCRVLVATSAADEGFDLQVASRVVHWDLSSSPATLMQRNGRVARLGQRTDVTAYYLILTGTHEERRDSRLQEKFGELGIDDEAMRNKILGMLDDEQISKLDEAIEQQDDKIVGVILRQADEDNQQMERELKQISTTMTATAVLNRDDLADRLGVWKKLGLPDSDFDFDFSTIEWDKPVFGDTAETESCTSYVASLRSERGVKEVVVFDPEFQVFGPSGDYSLAGLRPWSMTETRHNITKIRPDQDVDALGGLLCQLARLPDGDLAHLSREQLVAAVPQLAEASWLLFCTHPIKEAETELTDSQRPFLTVYAFGSDREPVGNTAFGSGEEVHKIIQALEERNIGRASLPVDVDGATIEAFGHTASEWLHGKTHYFRRSFTSEVKRFVPIPVAVVRILD